MMAPVDRLTAVIAPASVAPVERLGAVRLAAVRAPAVVVPVERLVAVRLAAVRAPVDRLVAVISPGDTPWSRWQSRMIVRRGGEGFSTSWSYCFSQARTSPPAHLS